MRAETDCLTVTPTTETAERDVLRHYACARWADDTLVVGNGDHVDVITAPLGRRVPLETIAEGIEPEPDPPIWTPRIALVAGSRSWFVSARRVGGEIVRALHALDDMRGLASVLTTYSAEASNPVADAPFAVVTESRGLQEMCGELFYSHLDENYRVLLVAGRLTSTSHPQVDCSFVLS